MDWLSSPSRELICASTSATACFPVGDEVWEELWVESLQVCQTLLCDVQLMVELVQPECPDRKVFSVDLCCCNSICQQEFHSAS